MLDDGTLAALHRRALGHRADLEPDDLRQGDRRRRRLRRADRRAAASRGSRARTLFFELALADLRRAAELFAPSPRAHRRRRRLGLARGLAAARRRRRGDDRAGARPARARPTCNIFIKIPGTEAGPDGDRGVDLRRRPGQRHAAVLRRAVPRRGRGLHARHRAPDRGRARPGGAVGRVAVHQPLGRRGRRRGARRAHATGSGSPSASGPIAPTASCSTPSAGSGSPTRARGRSGCCGRARGPRTPTPPTCSTSRRSRRRSRSTRCPRRRCSPSPTTARSASHCRPTAATPRRCWPSFAEAGIDVDALAERLQHEGAEAFVKLVAGAARLGDAAKRDRLAA